MASQIGFHSTPDYDSNSDEFETEEFSPALASARSDLRSKVQVKSRVSFRDLDEAIHSTEGYDKLVLLESLSRKSSALDFGTHTDAEVIELIKDMFAKRTFEGTYIAFHLGKQNALAGTPALGEFMLSKLDQHPEHLFSFGLAINLQFVTSQLENIVNLASSKKTNGAWSRLKKIPEVEYRISKPIYDALVSYLSGGKQLTIGQGGAISQLLFADPAVRKQILSLALSPENARKYDIMDRLSSNKNFIRADNKASLIKWALENPDHSLGPIILEKFTKKAEDVEQAIATSNPAKKKSVSRPRAKNKQPEVVPTSESSIDEIISWCLQHSDRPTAFNLASNSELITKGDESKIHNRRTRLTALLISPQSKLDIDSLFGLGLLANKELIPESTPTPMRSMIFKALTQAKGLSPDFQFKLSNVMDTEGLISLAKSRAKILIDNYQPDEDAIDLIADEELVDEFQNIDAIPKDIHTSLTKLGFELSSSTMQELNKMLLVHLKDPSRISKAISSLNSRDLQQVITTAKNNDSIFSACIISALDFRDTKRCGDWLEWALANANHSAVQSLVNDNNFWKFASSNLKSWNSLQTKTTCLSEAVEIRIASRR